MACGPAGLVVIDVDTHTAEIPVRDRILPGITVPDEVDLTGLATGFHTLAALAALHGEDCPVDDAGTLRVRTPSGGLHIWYRTQPGRRMLSSTGSGKNRALAWQVDVRGVGGYIVTPGTVTDAGSYIVEPGAALPRPVPAWLAAELERTGHTEPGPHPDRTPVVPSRAAEAVSRARHAAARHRAPSAPTIERTLDAVLAEVTACADVPEGAGFSGKLNRAAFTLGGLVAAGRVDMAEAEQRLAAAAAHARPSQERRAQAIIRSGLAAGLRRPLHAGDRA